jgi:ribosomal subunit interface protein
MPIKVIGSNVEIGDSLESYIKESLDKSVRKFFDNAIGAEVHLNKEGHLFKVILVINEGVKRSITVKANAEAGDPYGAFNEALKKSENQLRRYKEKIKNYHKRTSIKDINLEYNYINATKYVIPPVKFNVFEEMESEEIESNNDSSYKVINEKYTSIEELSVDEAIMKMDLSNLPALVFLNSENKRINVVYHRKDGNISWVDPQK